MHLFIMHTNLRRRDGHPYTESLGWMRACRERNISVQLFAHSAIEPDIAAETGAIPMFGATIADAKRYASAEDSPKAADALGEPLHFFLLASRATERGCKQAWARAERRPDAVIFPFADAAIMNGAAEWLADLEPTDRPKVLFNVVRPEHSWRLDPSRKKASGDFQYFRLATRRLRALASNSGLVITAVDSHLCELIASVGRVDCLPAPHHHYWPTVEELALLRPEAPKAELTIGIFGRNRLEKGSGMLTQIIGPVCAAHPEVLFFVQANNVDEGNALAANLRAQGGNFNVFIHAGALSHEDYFRQMLAVDLLLLPYAGSSYQLMPSGIFGEGVALGIPMVIPPGTWMSDRLAEGWGAGEVFANPTPESIVTTTLRAIANLPALAAKAAATDPTQWRNVHSLDAYIDHALSLLATAPAMPSRHRHPSAAV